MKYILLVSIVGLISLSSFKNVDLKDAVDGWTKIGESSVDFKSGSDVISIANPAGFKALQIQTPDAPVHIESLSIVYADGTPDKIPVRYDFKAGAVSRDITLKSNKRLIKEVDVTYSKVLNSTAAKATIQVWGM